MNGKLKIEFPSQGWTQILTARKIMLDAYDVAREHARSHEVETSHGNFAEGKFRAWLEAFLPKRYGVTSGYVISPGMSSKVKAPHYDVIIYDQLESPILWIEDNPDNADQGKSRAIPVEYVQAILEVKSSFSAKTVRDSLKHLNDLNPLMQQVDPQTERYKLYLPPTFCCGLIFFELCISESNSKTAMSDIIGGSGLRGFLGGLILRGEGHKLPGTGRISLIKSETESEDFHFSKNPPLLNDLYMSKTVKVAENIHIGSMLLWAEHHFASFAFDLIAMIQGKYDPTIVSSFYGLGATHTGLEIGGDEETMGLSIQR
jgi:hypothetical protein